MRKCLFALLSLFFLGADRPPMKFAVRGSHDPQLLSDYQIYFNDGWKVLAECVGSKTPPPEFQRVDNEASATIIIETHGNPDHIAAMTTWKTGEPLTGFIVFYVPNVNTYPQALRHLVIAHELGHFYYHLPDDYRSPTPDNGCLMTDHIHYKFLGRFCPTCRKIVGDYYKGLVR